MISKQCATMLHFHVAAHAIMDIISQGAWARLIMYYTFMHIKRTETSLHYSYKKRCGSMNALVDKVLYTNK